MSLKKRLDLEGKRFGKLTVVAFVGLAPNRASLWLCRCDCGEERTHAGSNLTRGNIVSCGCSRRGPRVDSPVDSHPDFGCFSGMLSRCNNPKSRGYRRYGARGINVCQRWLDGGFRVFIADMGARPTPQHSIDRINNDGGYWCGRPDCHECGPLNRVPNCRWATSRQQQNNRSVTTLLTYQGETLPLTEWSERLGVHRHTIQKRLDAGKPIEQVLMPKRIPWGESGIVRGSAHACAKLTEEMVRSFKEKRAAGRTIKSLAVEAGVTLSTVKNALSGRSWKHVK